MLHSIVNGKNGGLIRLWPQSFRRRNTAIERLRNNNAAPAGRLLLRHNSRPGKERVFGRGILQRDSSVRENIACFPLRNTSGQPAKVPSDNNRISRISTVWTVKYKNQNQYGFGCTTYRLRAFQVGAGKKQKRFAVKALFLQGRGTARIEDVSFNVVNANGEWKALKEAGGAPPNIRRPSVSRVSVQIQKRARRTSQGVSEFVFLSSLEN